jgi:hypothetical protein
LQSLELSRSPDHKKVSEITPISPTFRSALTWTMPTIWLECKPCDGSQSG